jgi:hypothetical protein
MSEARKPDMILHKKLPPYDGKKHGDSSVVWLYRGTQFARKWTPISREFSPKVPLVNSMRKTYWETRYRVKIDGKWHMPNAKYELLTLPEVSAIMGMI